MNRLFPGLFRKSGALFLSLLIYSYPLTAAVAVEIGEEDLFDLASKQTVQTMTLSQIPLSRNPGPISVLTSKQIAEYGASNLDEIIGLLPGADVRMSQMGFAGFFRGFGGSPFQEGIQFRIDGLLYNSPDKGGSAANPGYSSFPVPVEMIEQVEVVREPASSLYGPNAFYGVINVITKKGKDLKNGGTLVSRVSDLYNGRDFQRYAAVYGDKRGDFDYVVSGEFFRQRSPMFFNKDSNIFDSSINAKVKYKDLELSWYSRGEESDPFVFLSTTTKRARQDVYLAGLQYSKDITSKISVNSKSSLLSRTGSNCMVCHNPYGYHSLEPDDDVENFKRYFQNINTKVKITDGHEVTLGGEFMQDREHMDASVLGNARVVNNTYSGFVQYIASLHKDLTATLGLREDFSEWSNQGPLLSPRASLVYTPMEEWTLRSGYSRAYRLPDYHDLYLFMKFLPVDPSSVGGELFLMGNPDLRPEVIDTVNVGTDYWLSNKSLVKINGFFSRVKDQIDRKIIFGNEVQSRLPNGLYPNGESPVTTGPIFGQTLAQLWVNNPTQASILGGELEYQYKPFKFLELSANYSYKNVTFDQDPEPLMGGHYAPNAPHHLMGGGITVYPIRNLMMNVTGKYRGEYYTSFGLQGTPGLDPFYGKEPAPDVFFLDFHIAYRLPYGFKASLIGRNMLNQEAQDWKITLDNRLRTGRDFFLQLAYEFGGYS